MTDESQQVEQQEDQGGILSALNLAIDGLNLAKEVSGPTPAKAVFGSVAILLLMIRDTMVNEQDYVDLGISCADICNALKRGVDGKELDDFSKSVRDAISQLTTTVAEIQKKVMRRSGRHRVSRFLHARQDKDTIAAWKSDLNRILHVFNTELAMNTYATVSGMHHNVLKILDRQDRVTQTSAPGELPPPSPRVFFGRDDLIERIVHFAERLTPIALIGAGGIGKTSVILTILHDNRIKERFGKDRRFIRCDQFPASRTHFLRRLSEVIGAGIENPEDLTHLRPFLSSKEMLIVLDNAESILDPRGPGGQEIYNIVDELTQVDNICLCITSRISTIPPYCETLDVPTLSMEAARDTFHRIYRHGERSEPINDILRRLDFHPLSVALLATVAQYNRWNTDRLIREWDRQRTGVLHAEHSSSLATTIELSLTSPMFCELGPDARGFLEVVAFFPQGINEEHVNWLFPTISDRSNILDKFCILSLTYRSNGFVTMLAPLRDYLRPKDPVSSPLLTATKERYFTRLFADISPDKPSFEESRWIATEDVNIEHLLDVFTSVDVNSKTCWAACSGFMDQLYWHKPRLVVLGPKIETLPDDHPSKAHCLRDLSWLFDSVGNFAERKRLLTHALILWREQGDNYWTAQALRDLADANRRMGLIQEGIPQAKEASETFERLGDRVKQAESLIDLARLLSDDKQLDTAEEVASRAIGLLPKTGQQLQVCLGHRVLGNIYSHKANAEKAIHHYEVARGIASALNMVAQSFWVHFDMVEVFVGEGRFNDAQTHIEQARSYAANHTYLLARASLLQARCWEKQDMVEKAKSEALCALDLLEKLGAEDDAEGVRRFLWRVDGGAGQS